MNQKQKLIIGAGALGLFLIWRKKLDVRYYVWTIAGVTFLVYLTRDKRVVKIDRLNKDWKKLSEKERKRNPFSVNPAQTIIDEILEDPDWYLVRAQRGGGVMINVETGDQLELYASSPRKLSIAYIGVPEKRRFKGEGSKLMEMITDKLDQYGVDATLEIAEEQYGFLEDTRDKFHEWELSYDPDDWEVEEHRIDKAKMKVTDQNYQNLRKFYEKHGFDFKKPLGAGSKYKPRRGVRSWEKTSSS